MIRYEHLCAKQFNLQTQNCHTSLRALFRDNWGIELSDIPCPVDFNERRMNLYAPLASSEGFDVLHCHPRDYRPGDVFLMAIQSPHGNHVGVLLEDGRMFHHLYGQISGVTNYGGMFRNNTVGVYRHRDVPQNVVDEAQVDLLALLPPSVRKKIKDLQELRQNSSSTPEDPSAS